MPEFLHPLMDWLANHTQWLGLGIFLITLIECLALIGVIWPGVVLLFSAAVLAGQADMGLALLLLLAWAGALLGNTVSYLLGARLQGRARRLPLLRSHPQWLIKAELHLENYGATSLFVGHFIGPIRPLLPLLAGMLRMPVRLFAFTNLTAAGIWSLSAVLPGWLVGSALGSTPPDGFWPQAGFIGLGLSLLAFVGVSLQRHGSAKRFHIMAIAAAVLMSSLLIGWPWLESFDLYLQSLTQQVRSASLDRLFTLLTLFGDVRQQIALDALLCAGLLFYRARGALLFAVSTLLGSVLINAVLKKLLARARPDLLLEPLTGYSLPSGHSVRSFAFCLTVAVLLGIGRTWRWRLSLIGLACLLAAPVAFSRVYLTAHWPTDTFAGALLAITACAASLAWWQPRQPLQAVPNRFWQLYGLAALLGFIGFALWRYGVTALKYTLA